MRSPIRHVLAAAAAITVGAACVVSDEEVDGPSVEHAADQTRSACELVTAEEITALTGEPILVTEVHREGGYSECNYTDPTGTWPLLILSVIWEGGREAMDASLTGTALAGALLDGAIAPDAGGDTIVAVGPVTGLGDQAYYRDLAPSYVLSDDVMLSLVVAYMPDAERNFRPLVETILGRL